MLIRKRRARQIGFLFPASNIIMGLLILIFPDLLAILVGLYLVIIGLFGIFAKIQG